MGRERQVKAARRLARNAGAEIAAAPMVDSSAPLRRVISPERRAMGGWFLDLVEAGERLKRRQQAQSASAMPVRIPFRVRLHNWWNRMLVRLHLRPSWVPAKREE